MNLISSHRLVKGEDLNHHGTLFAGRGAEWFVESGFIAASKYLNPQYVICLKIHGMHFSKPVRPGEVIVLKSAIVYTGRTSLTAHVDVFNAKDESIVDGFITLHSMGIGGVSDRAIRIVKMRRTNHSRGPVPMKIVDTGIVVLPEEA